MREQKNAELLLAQMASEGIVPGVQYLVARENSVEFEFHGGSSNLASGQKVTPETTFMCSSSTKAFTSSAVLQLVEQGKIHLNKSLSAYFPDHPYPPQLTIRTLLNHTGGVPNPVPLNWLHRVEDHAHFEEDRVLDVLLTRYRSLDFTPGSRYSYSNLGYWLLGKVVEHVSGMPYGQYVSRNILAPLEIPGQELSFAIPDHAHARGYLAARSPWSMAVRFMLDKAFVGGVDRGRTWLRPVYMNGPSYGGLIGTTRGLVRFLQAQLRHASHVFSHRLKDFMFAPQTDHSGRVIPATLGWQRGRLGDAIWFGKPGGGPGYQSNLRIYPAAGFVTVCLINQAALTQEAVNRFTDGLDACFVR